MKIYTASTPRYNINVMFVIYIGLLGNFSTPVFKGKFILMLTDFNYVTISAKCRDWTWNFHIILISSNKMQQYAGIYLLQNYSIWFVYPSHPSSGVHKSVTAASGTGNITYLGNRLLPVWPIYATMQIQFYVLLMMAAMDTRKLWSNFVLNKYLHTVAS